MATKPIQTWLQTLGLKGRSDGRTDRHEKERLYLLVSITFVKHLTVEIKILVFMVRFFVVVVVFVIFILADTIVPQSIIKTKTIDKTITHKLNNI